MGIWPQHYPICQILQHELGPFQFYCYLGERRFARHSHLFLDLREFKEKSVTTTCNYKSVKVLICTWRMGWRGQRPSSYWWWERRSSFHSFTRNHNIFRNPPSFTFQVSTHSSLKKWFCNQETLSGMLTKNWVNSERSITFHRRLGDRRVCFRRVSHI